MNRQSKLTLGITIALCLGVILGYRLFCDLETQRQHEAHRQAHTYESLKACSLLVLMYANDHDSVLPPKHWMGAVSPYSKDALKLFRLPRAAIRAPVDAYKRVLADPKYEVPGEFGRVLNQWLVERSLDDIDAWNARSEEEVPPTQKMVLVFEAPGEKWNAIGDPRSRQLRLSSNSEGVLSRPVAYLLGGARAVPGDQIDKLYVNPDERPSE